MKSAGYARWALTTGALLLLVAAVLSAVEGR